MGGFEPLTPLFTPMAVIYLVYISFGTLGTRIQLPFGRIYLETFCLCLIQMEIKYRAEISKTEV